jgi:hypothetical protein
MFKPVPWSWVFRKPVVPKVIKVVPFAETDNWLSHFFIPSGLNAVHIQTRVLSFVLILLFLRFHLVCHVDSGLRDVKIKVFTYCSYPHTCYVPCLSYLPGLYHPNDVFMLHTLHVFKWVSAGNLTLAASVVCWLYSLLGKIPFLAEKG